MAKSQDLNYMFVFIFTNIVSMILGSMIFCYMNSYFKFKSLLLIILTVFLSGCFWKKIPYNDEQLNTFYKRQENVQLTFETDAGQQVAYYIPPLENPENVPKKVAILYPGVQSVALDWLKFIRLDDDKKTGYLLVDYPGRGFSEGLMNPGEFYKISEGALSALAKHFKVDSIDPELFLMGHSLGSGAALQFASREKVTRIVLVAPFNTLREAAAHHSFILWIFMPNQVDNRKLIKSILSKALVPQIVIIHGTKDKSLPIEMGRELKDISSEDIVFYEILDGDHSSILTTHRDLIFKSLLGTSSQYSSNSQ
jgi:surfactin synthase thioesterase subunit